MMVSELLPQLAVVYVDRPVADDYIVAPKTFENISST